MKSEEVAEKIGRFGKAFSQWLEVEMAAAGTTASRARLLYALKCTGTCKMNDLSNRLQVTPRNVTKLVDALESEGLVERNPHPEDRRATLISLTDRGMRTVKETILKNDVVLELFEELPDADRVELGRILEQLLEGLARRGFSA
ncbi:MarR family winged helix-turn-helix transcriptional regulator [Blastopirellula marina]|uniref:MarR family transcriptional regulator n=1 Tax=Blastopirellula marina TaxID=124 RepID=A0A2S8F370_9BACT|nr:MarR family transcriptional regulator [Blastopirellula marina]PQO26600.1 MarR family transcriptional regulator [Blastopirellula marina]PQO45150.1 MarR family transcriptional regulator [Blastopirellula marina]PTL40911.1 MarR family transcriptional regulator [Blastopirellula marina]